MYSLKQLVRAIQEPRRVAREINRAYHTKLFTQQYNPSGIDIHAEDWDNLIIFDACRYDAYEQHALPQLPNGDFKSKISKAASTPQWIRANFSDRQLHDTVYVTGNSWILNIGDEINADLHAVELAKNDFDVEQQCQVEAGINANRSYPNKRLIVHLIPPHHPFIGPIAECELPPPEEQGNNFFKRFRTGEFEIDRGTLWKIYLENLDRSINAAKILLEELPGKTVITADHGELLGDRGFPIPINHWGHPNKLWMRKLVTVPWHVFDSDERRDIVAEPPPEDWTDQRSPEKIEEDLRALGYQA
jgi:hypothetical protein